MTGVPQSLHSKAAEWQHKLLACVAGLLTFEVLTGLSIYLLPFSVPNQIMVLLHTVAGLIFVAPFLYYQIRHWLIYRATRLNHYKLTGYFAMLSTTVAVVSGIVVTVQAVFGLKISYAWDLAHIVATFAVIASALPHVLLLILRNVKGRQAEAIKVRAAEVRFVMGTLALVVPTFAVLALAIYAYEPVKLTNEFPDDYSYSLGPDRPFAPSLARTNTGGAFDARSLGRSQTCGKSRCHDQVAREWEVSAHRYSAMDPAFQAVQKVMAKQNGPESTRYCGGCHDPISLFSGAKNIFAKDLTNQTGYQEGVSCIVCHSIKETDIKGNAAYVLTQPRQYMFEMRDGRAAQFVSDFLIRSYPKHHVKSLEHRLFKSPEFCAACHKQFIDEEVNQVGWVQLQNQYDNWRKSRWNHPGDPRKTIECRECHMPLTDSHDPASGDDADYNRSAKDGKHRNHRFLAANQFVPTALDLPGAKEHVELTNKWLRGDIDIPEIEDKWRSGPAIPVELVVPQQVSPGQEIDLHAVISSNKPGHDFPTGPLDIIQAWVELTVKDQDGRMVFHSGLLDDQNFVEPGTFMFKVEAVDQYGKLIDRHNLWEMVGVRYRRSLFPGFSDKAEYSFRAPDNGATELHVSAKVQYRKADQFFLNFLFGKDAGVTAPVTTISQATTDISLSSASTR
ncbi:MAG: multiheme c-type cytochrome [Gemmatimonadales bacterium]